MDTPQIYVACLAAYNNGILFGAWIDATQDADAIHQDIYDMLAASPIEHAEEWAIHDYSDFDGARIDEYESIEHVADIAQFVTEHGELGATLLSEHPLDDARSFLEDGYHGAYDSEVDYARTIVEDCYSDAIPKNLIYYFDYEAFARDLFINDYFSVEAQGQTHVFSYH